MAITIESAYSGEVLERLLVKATTTNEIVDRGLMHLEPNVSTEFYIPRMRVGKMLQKRKEQPDDSDSKGDFNIDERAIRPQEFMAFTTFNPRAFEKIWRKWQPTGELVFAELPTEAQNTLLDAMAASVDFELGYHFIMGRFGDTDDELFNGIVTRMLSDRECINLLPGTETTMIKKLKRVVQAIPAVMRKNPGLRILMSTTDSDTYDDELTAQAAKGANYTDMNQMRFKGIKIEPLAQWPSGLLVATICGMDQNTNLWGGVNYVNDFDAIKIAPLTNAGEKYFFKMLMKADTNIAFGEDVVILDAREKTKVQVSGKNIPVTTEVSTVIYEASEDDCELTITGEPFLGMRVVLQNTHATYKMTVSGVEVPAKSTVVLAYDGKRWFKAV